MTRISWNVIHTRGKQKRLTRNDTIIIKLRECLCGSTLEGVFNTFLYKTLPPGTGIVAGQSVLIKYPRKTSSKQSVK